MRTSCPYSVNGNVFTGCGYGISSYVMLPGATSAGACASAFVCSAAAIPANPPSALRRDNIDINASWDFEKHPLGASVANNRGRVIHFVRALLFGPELLAA